MVLTTNKTDSNNNICSDRAEENLLKVTDKWKLITGKRYTTEKIYEIRRRS